MDNNKKIFGLGLSKTGTTSLTKALEVLGYSSIHYPRGFEEIEIYDTATDLFVALNFKRLDKMYPNSHFILTTRELDQWLDSVKRHRKKLVTPEKGSFGYEMRMKTYGCVEFDENKLTKAFLKHHENVNRYFKIRPESLLEVDLTNGDGWVKLCRFLDKPIPNEPFPVENVASSASLAEAHGKRNNDNIS